MGWEKGRYYTRSHKINGRVVREYVGGDIVGELAAGIDERRRERRKQEREAWLAHKKEIESEDESFDEACKAAELLAKAAMIVAGYHYHRGEWRLKRERTDVG
jgi:hypothetical protein